MSADVVVIITSFANYLRSLGLVVHLDPVSIDLPDVSLRLAYSGAGSQGVDRERISMDATLVGSGIDPGKYLGRIMAHSRILSGLIDKSFAYPLSASLKARAEIRQTVEGRFSREEAEDKFDWSFQALYRIDLSYNPAVLDHPELAGS